MAEPFIPPAPSLRTAEPWFALHKMGIVKKVGLYPGRGESNGKMDHEREAGNIKRFMMVPLVLS